MIRIRDFIDKWAAWFVAAILLTSIVALVAYCSGRIGADQRNRLAIEQANTRIVEAVGDANTAAAEQRGGDQARAKVEDTALQEVIKNAPDVQVSDTRRRYYECVRMQSEARKAGRSAPAGCGPVLPR
jgi:hypothetical protein